MSILDILKQYADPSQPPAGNAEDHFNEVAQQAAPQDLGQGISSAFRSDATPPFGQMIGSLFGQSNPQQQAGLLGTLLRSVAPGALTSVAGGALGHVLGGNASSTITPDQASRLSPSQVTEIAAHAEQHDDSIVDKLGSFYAQHPALVQTLGAAALGVVMRNMRNR